MNEPVTRERIDRAIRWCRANKAAIAEKLPISIPGVVFKIGWTASLVLTPTHDGKFHGKYLLDCSMLVEHISDEVPI